MRLLGKNQKSVMTHAQEAIWVSASYLEIPIVRRDRILRSLTLSH